ncbi:hypothetical protein FHT87_004606 [Rhizobium sp. BK316]|uniref:hypothetical protein n=1 Tax=Rhizobium sp. BK316 TaxID=2587053 RepID=UPI00162207F0|nr:hypothetical protein [Rhizobium sp. BK316]MBB3410674.1 hypothetical protein [Rhizobium sp. BK316]
MFLHSPVRMKFFADLQVGELCQVQFGTGLGISFPIAIDGPRRLIAILKLGEEVRPTVHEVVNLRTPCLSYGQDWVLAPEVNASATISSRHSETPGAIHLYTEGATMYLAPFTRESMMDGYRLALPGFGQGQIPTDSIPVLKWKLWTSEADRQRPGATPLLEFSHQ